jgi:putative transposase
MIPGEFYHLFNHANGWENVFIEDKNYDFFLKKMTQHILPVCRIYAYCLMKNHFHLLVRVRQTDELQLLWQKDKASNDLTERKLVLKTSKAYGNFFSSYTQAFNKVYNRMGSLFIPNMKTELVNSNDYFRNTVLYIHKNPVHHKFAKKIEDWKHSSYKTFLSDKKTKLEREYVLKAFGGLDNFIKLHQQRLEAGYKWAEA